MRIRLLTSWFVLFLVLQLTGGAHFATAQEDTPERAFNQRAWDVSVDKKLITIEQALEDLNKRLPRTGPFANYSSQPPTRAIVAARVKVETGSGEVWKGRLISMDLGVSVASSFVLHIDPGANLALVNLCDEDVKFTFHQSLLKEGFVFTVHENEVVIVTVKTGVEVVEGNDPLDRRFFYIYSEKYFSSLPGPLILIP